MHRGPFHRCLAGSVEACVLVAVSGRSAAAVDSLEIRPVNRQNAAFAEASRILVAVRTSVISVFGPVLRIEQGLQE